MNIIKTRKDFPLLDRKKPIIYFDNSCMTLRPRQVIDKIVEYYERFPTCHGRSVHTLSNFVTQEFDDARRIIQKFINAKDKEIVFTKNCTEAINVVANGLDLNKGDVVINSDREHSSNIVPWLKLQKDKGIKRIYIKSKKDESFDLKAYEDELKKNKGKVKLVSMVYISNLDGYIMPVKQIIKLAHKYKAPVLLDAAQAVPHIAINVKRLDVDFLTFSGHKMCGPNGVGVLYGKKTLLEKLNSFIVGGDTVSNTTYKDYEEMPVPERFEAGLQNYAAVMGLGAACKYLKKIGMNNIEKHVAKLDDRLKSDLQTIPRVKLIGNKETHAGVTTFVIDGINYHDAAMILDSANIAVRSGQHCVHSWFNDRKISGSIRASLYFYNTEDEVKQFIIAVKKLASYL